jgi:membrane protein YqaA with SNARE-associated domain
MFLSVAFERPLGWAFVSIALGSLAGGAVGFFISRRISHWSWLERKLERLRLAQTIERMKRHPYRWALIASLTPVAYSWLCYLAGFHRLSTRFLLVLSLLRIPKLGIYFAIVRAGWMSLPP